MSDVVLIRTWATPLGPMLRAIRTGEQHSPFDEVLGKVPEAPAPWWYSAYLDDVERQRFAPERAPYLPPSQRERVEKIMRDARYLVESSSRVEDARHLVWEKQP